MGSSVKISTVETIFFNDGHFSSCLSHAKSLQLISDLARVSSGKRLGENVACFFTPWLLRWIGMMNNTRPREDWYTWYGENILKKKAVFMPGMKIQLTCSAYMPTQFFMPSMKTEFYIPSMEIQVYMPSMNLDFICPKWKLHIKCPSWKHQVRIKTFFTQPYSQNLSFLLGVLERFTWLSQNKHLLVITSSDTADANSTMNQSKFVAIQCNLP